ncbi:unnamed protein product [Urochloa humidicola]
MLDPADATLYSNRRSPPAAASSSAGSQTLVPPHAICPPLQLQLGPVMGLPSPKRARGWMSLDMVPTPPTPGARPRDPKTPSPTLFMAPISPHDSPLSPPSKRRRGRSTPPVPNRRTVSPPSAPSPRRRSSSSPPSPMRGQPASPGSRVKTKLNYADSESIVGIFWDYENCGVPRGTELGEVYENAKTALSHHAEFSGKIIKFCAYADFSFRHEVTRTLQDSGLEIEHCPHDKKPDAADKVIFAELLKFALDYPKSSIVLISGDVDFARCLRYLTERNYNVAVVIPSKCKVSSKLTISAKVVFSWSHFARGKGIGIVNSSISYGNLRDLKKEMISLFGDADGGMLRLSEISLQYSDKFSKPLLPSHYGYSDLREIFEVWSNTDFLLLGGGNATMVYLNTDLSPTLIAPKTVKEQGGDSTSIRDEGNVVEQCTGDQQRTTSSDSDAEDQKMLGQGFGVLGAAKVDIAVESQKDTVVVDQAEDGISAEDEQCTSDQLITSKGGFAVEDREASREKIGFSAGYPQRPGKLNCRFYMSNGNCSNGSSCHFNHPQLKEKLEASNFPSERREVEYLELNRAGLPIREGARTCRYYMRNGTCRYGKKCWFNHPERLEQVLDIKLHMPTGWDDTNLQSSPHSKKSAKHATMNDISPGNVPRTEKKEMKAKKDPDWSSASDDSDGCCSADSSDGPLCKQEHHPAARITLQGHMYQQQKCPERPGQPDCQYYMQFGKCEFQSACKFNHPKDILSSGWQTAECPFYKKTGEAIDDGTSYEHDFVTKSDNVLRKQEKTMYPERPGEPECPHHLKYGYCKLQNDCKFHHPTDRSSRN